MEHQNYNGMLVQHRFGKYRLLIVGINDDGTEYYYQAFYRKNRLWKNPLTEREVRREFEQKEITEIEP